MSGCENGRTVTIRNRLGPLFSWSYAENSLTLTVGLDRIFAGL